MAKFRHSIALDAVPRRWFVDCVAAAHDVIESEIDGAKFQLAEGRHLQPGARYTSEDDQAELIITSWDRREETAVNITLVDEDVETVYMLSLRSASAPDAARFDGLMDFMRFSWLVNMSWRADADLERWWATVPKHSPAPITVVVHHKLGRAIVDLSPTAMDSRRWQISMVASVRGRLLLRPVAALGLLIMRRKIRVTIDEKLAVFAEKWNATLPELLPMTQEQLRAKLHDSIAASRKSRTDQALKSTDPD